METRCSSCFPAHRTNDPATQPVDTLKFSRRFLPFERQVLSAAWELMNPRGRLLLAGQIRHVNRIQRLLDWTELELYCMRWFRVSWPAESLFRDKDEFELATVLLRHGEQRIKVTVWSVGGHVFQLQSPTPLKPLREVVDLVVDNAHAGHHQYKETGRNG